MSAPESSVGVLQIEFDNEVDEECTVIRVEGKDQSDLLMSLTGAFVASGIVVVSASIDSENGRIEDVFRVTTMDGAKLTEDLFEAVRKQILLTTSSSQRSSKPAIYGIVAAAEVMRLRPLSGVNQGDVGSLELAAAEMAQAAAVLVSREREIMSLTDDESADKRVLATKESQRAEAATALERKMAAMEAVLAARRAILVPTLDIKIATKKEKIMEQMKPQVKQGGPAMGDGTEILLQAFNWESHKKDWYNHLAKEVRAIAALGVSSVWLPPPSDAVSPQGYLPRDLYELNCAYGSEKELRELISVYHEYNIKVCADIVVNHRCAHQLGPDGKWNKFGGRLAWDATAVCNNNPSFGGKGAPKTGDDYVAAPNIDHTQERVRQDIITWMKYLRNSIGFDGWRYDFVRGYSGIYAKIFTDETVPTMSFGEYWDTCDYTDGVLNYNQDAHRQRTINWCDSTGGTSAAFDFTTKGILQEACGRKEYWRLIDSKGRPPGVIGLWPARAVTFLDNHDTGSTLNHWPFPAYNLPEGYAYILTHPGTPCVFYDHLYSEKADLRKAVIELMAIRRRNGLTAKSTVAIKKVAGDLYAAVIDGKVAMKMGTGDWSPNATKAVPGKVFKMAASGPNFAVWEAE
jgi:alpha-amylase